MSTLSLYTASITQTGTSIPVATDGSGGKGNLISGSWSRLATGSYKFTRTSGNFFVPFSGSVQGSMVLSAACSTTASFSFYMSGSDSASIYLNTFLPNNSYTLADNVLSGSGVQFNVSIGY